MAKNIVRRTKVRKVVRHSQTVIPPGPVTLRQARTLARVSAPAERAGKAALVATSPASVGAERRKLEVKQDLERRRRLKEYKATLSIMKKRGVKGLAPAATTGGRAAKTTTKPLQVFAEGDSWFDYPVPFFGGGVIPRLEDKLGVPVLNMAKAGDEVRYMLGAKQRKQLMSQLSNGCPAGGTWDAMLFSGGGNDIVDNQMALWIRDFRPGVPAAALVHQGRLDSALALVRAGYEDLIELRDSLSPQTWLFFHGYDFAIPDGRGVCHLGPWLKPTFDLRGFPTRTSAFDVTKELLRQFAAMLQALEAVHPRVRFITTQGTLGEQTSSWHNELHPSKAGFKKFAALFHQVLKAAFPNQVL